MIAMGEAFIFYVLFTLFFGTHGLPAHDDFARCSESCLKLVPQNSNSEDHQKNAAPLTHQMIKHCAKLTVDGKCECDWEKIQTEAGDCECLNPLKTINASNQCVCNYDKCPPQPMKNCNKFFSSANDENNCTCPKYQCEYDEDADEDDGDTCPEDSYRSNQTQDGDDDGWCLCYPCKLVTCKHALVVRKGTNKPGTCCDLYHCDDLHMKKTCEKDGRNYTDGQTWTQDDCSIFRCENGIIFQELKEDCVHSHPCFSKT